MTQIGDPTKNERGPQSILNTSQKLLLTYNIYYQSSYVYNVLHRETPSSYKFRFAKFTLSHIGINFCFY